MLDPEEERRCIPLGLVNTGTSSFSILLSNTDENGDCLNIYQLYGTYCRRMKQASHKTTRSTLQVYLATKNPSEVQKRFVMRNILYIVGSAEVTAETRLLYRRFGTQRFIIA